MVIYLVDSKYDDGPRFNEYTGNDAASATAIYDQCEADGAHVTLKAIGHAPHQIEIIYDSDD